MTGRFDGHSVVVTGATGIAGASARLMAAEGAAVFLIAIDAAECAALAEAIEADGGSCHWAAADLTEEAATVASFDEAVDLMGRIDGVLAVVGGSGRRFGDGPVHEIPLEGWDRTLELNLTTTFLTSREALRRMLAQDVSDHGRGSLALMSSVLAEHPAPEHFATHAYAAAKGGVIALTRAMAARYAPDQVRVNAIAPAAVSTPMSRRASDDSAIVDYVARRQPLAGGFLEAQDVAATAAFLLSPDARHLTGEVLRVDGGWAVTG